MDTKRYKYYLDFNTFVTRNKTIYITINLTEFFFFYLSLVDAINNKFQNDETLYSIPNIFAKLVFKKINKDILFAVLIIIIFINYIFIFFYGFIFKNVKYASVYINYNEIFHLRLLTGFYFAIFSRYTNFYLFLGILIMLIFICYSISHFNINHIDLFVPDFICLPYDSFSCIIDKYYIILKFLIPFSLKNQVFKDLILSFSISIIIFLAFYTIYIIHYFDIFLFINKKINILKISLNFFISILSIILILYPNFSFFSVKFIIVEISVLIFSFIISWYLIFKNKIPVIESTSPFNIYFYFCFFYNDNYKYKLLFFSALEDHKVNCGKCVLCTNIKLENKISKINEETEDKLIGDENIQEKNNFSFFETLKLIMDTYKKYGFAKLVKNKKIVLNILMTLKNLSFKKAQIHQYLSLLTIYHKIMNENKNEIEEVDVLMTDIYSINEFIELSSQFIDYLTELFERNPNLIKVETLFKLVDHASKLDSKHFKDYFGGSKTLKNIVYQMTICTIIYEEIFNKPIHKSHLSSIREHYQDIEETLNLFDYNKQVTFNFDIYQDKIYFVRSGQEFYKYIGTNFFHLFPIELYQYQKNLIKDLICNEDSKKNDTEVKSGKFIIILDKSKKIYHMLKINFRVLIQEKNLNIITLDGLYSLSSNFLISYIKNEKEYYFGSGLYMKANKISENHITLEKFKSKYKLRFKEGLRFDHSFKIDNLEFKIYKFGEERFKTKTIHSLYGSDMIEDTRSHIFANLNTVGSSSTASSTLKSTSNNLTRFRVKSIAETTKEINLRFFMFQKFIIIFIVVLFILTIVEVLLKKKRKNVLINDYEIFTEFRLVTRTYNYMTSSFRCLTCLVLPNKTKCINYFEKYNLKLTENNPEITIDMLHLFYLSNHLKVSHEIEYMNNLWSLIYANSDKSLRNLFIDDFEYKDISSIFDNGTLVFKYMTIEFMEAFKGTINSFIVVNASGNQYINEPFFIFNNDSLIDYYPTPDDEWRIHLYNIIVNYDSFCNHFDIIHDIFNDKVFHQLNFFVEETIIFLVVNLLIEYFGIVIIIVYLYTFENVMIKIYKHIKERISNKDFNQAFINKLHILKDLRYIYAVHPKKIIEDLQDVYDEYKRIIKEKNKKKIEENKISNTILTEPKRKDKKVIKEENLLLLEIQNTKISKFSRNMYQRSIMLATLIFIIFLILWIVLLKKTKELFLNIDSNSKIETHAYRFFSYYQSILYSTVKIEEKSLLLKEDLIESIIRQEELTFIIDAETASVKEHFKRHFNKIGFSCHDFYQSLEDIRLELLEKNNPEKNFTKDLIEICEKKRFLISYTNTYYLIMQKMFGMIYRGILSLTQLTLYNREYFFVDNDYYFETTYFLFLIFRFFRTGINKLLYTPSINYYMDSITFLFTIGAVVEIVAELIFLLIVIFLFMIKINFIYKRLLEITDIIKIYKDDHLLI